MSNLLLWILFAVSPFQIPEVEVTGVQVKQTPQVVAQISHAELEVLPITNVADILAYLPSVDVRARGASNAQSDISLRGGTFDQVLVLLNGIPISDTQTGHYSMNIPISSALIERIEILQNVHLTGALTGAINIVTRDAYTDAYTIQLSGGTNGTVNPVFAGSWNRKEARINASAEYARSDGYYAPTDNTKEQEALRNTDYQLANLYFQTRWEGLDVQAGAQYKDAGLGTGYGFASTDQFDATRTLFTSARYEHPFYNGWKLLAQVDYRGQHDRYEWHRGTVTNLHWTHNTHAAFSAEYNWLLGGKTHLGAAFKDEYISSTNMGEHNRWQATLHAGHRYRWRGLEASIDVAGHYNSWCGWYGSGVAAIRYTKTRWAVGLNAIRSLRMPTWTDLYYHAGVQRGNTDLKAEKAWQLALDGHYTWHWQQAGHLSLAGDVYYRWGQDIIDWTYNEADQLFYATNRQKINTFGFDVSARYHWNQWLRNVGVQYTFTDLSLDLVQAKSMYLDYLKHKIVVNIDHGIYIWSKGCVGADWSLRWQNREGTYVDINGQAGNPFRPVLLLDGSIYLKLPHVRIAAECTNMSNRTYYDYGGILAPGVQGRLRICAKLN